MLGPGHDLQPGPGAGMGSKNPDPEPDPEFHAKKAHFFSKIANFAILTNLQVCRPCFLALEIVLIC